MKRIIKLLHPFSAQAIGLEESDLYFSHSKPHENALRKIKKKKNYKVVIEYFTGKVFSYKKNISGIIKVFWPVTKPLFNNRHVWRKQHSFFHLFYNWISPPDLTIINMSGHGSNYVFKLANMLNGKQKQYVAMIGGMNISTTGKAIKYYQNANHIIVHTQIQKNNLKQLESFKDLTINVIPLGVDTSLFKPIQVKSEEIELLFVGRISRLKQIEKAIEALNYIVNNNGEQVVLNIIGPISDQDYFEELKELVTAFGLNNKVSFLGSLNQKDIIPFYQKASLLLLPSKHESFGMVMVEAMACGTPVIALIGAGGPDEIIEDGKNGFLCSIDNFNQTVYKTISSKNLLLDLNKKCREIVESKWSLNYTTICFQNTINSVFSNK